MSYLSVEHDTSVSVLDRLSSMVAYWDRDLRCRYANHAYRAWLGERGQDVIGASKQDLLPPALFAASEPHIRAALDGRPQVFERMIAGHDGGSARHGLTRYHPDIVDGVVHGFVVEIADIPASPGLEAAPPSPARNADAVAQARERTGSLLPEQAPAEAALQRQLAEQECSAERKTAFLFSLAHELRNCISPISAGLQMLRKRLADPGSEKIGAIMARQLAHMSQLVDDVYDMRRIQAGEFELRLARLSLNDVVAGAIDMCATKVAQSRHRLSVALPDHDVMLTGDGVRLTQILVNLVSNACKFTPPGGHIHVALAVEDGRFALLSVRDSGIGLCPEALESIFELYVQVDEAGRRTGAGLGIGLHLVRQMVALHGGVVCAASDGPGKGTTLTVRLPLR